MNFGLWWYYSKHFVIKNVVIVDFYLFNNTKKLYFYDYDYWLNNKRMKKFITTLYISTQALSLLITLGILIKILINLLKRRKNGRELIRKNK